jgi:anti-sigma factor RsiW
MTCHWSAKLDLYVDSELPAVEMADFQRHLQTCPACAAGALSRLQMKRLTQAVGQRYRPSPEFRLRIEQSVGAPKTRLWLSRWLPALALAAALLLVVPSTAWWLQYSRSQQALAEIADLHVATLASANPVDVVSTDRHTVKPWFQGKLPFSFNLPELQNSPFKLLGGRLAYFHQSPGAQLLFELGKHEISVFIFQNRRDDPSLSSPSSVKKNLTFSTETWADAGLRYFVVGDCNPTDLHSLGELLKDAARP